MTSLQTLPVADWTTVIGEGRLRSAQSKHEEGRSACEGKRTALQADLT